ncbi:MAG: S41 family peptidase [Alphaproteobacteria bacterium]|nr:S41 family peptidase [Alphaproteobacteria bacterium]
MTSAIGYKAIAQEEPRTAGIEKKDDKSYSETYKYLNLFGDVFERVRAQYVEEVADKELIEYAVNGMLSSLDPHSSYLNEERYNEMKVETRGQFGGLGIEVTMENGLVKVVTPIDDTPAFRAGIQSGDYIVKIDGEAVMGLTLSDAVKMMRGKVGTTIDLEIHRENMEAPMSVTLTRDVINIKSVRHRIEGNAGYIRVTQFSSNTEEGLKAAIEDIKKQLGDKLIGYVIDLRNNPGGLLEQAIAVSDAFLDNGEIVSTRGRHEDDTKRDNSTPGDLANGLPIVVLINGGSASASEIVAGALQDHKRGILLGTKSFGKGSVQTVIPLPGHGAMRLTTARYYTPSGRSIQATGIEPDIIVEQARVEALKSSRIRESDLHGALDKKDSNTPAADKAKPEQPPKPPAAVEGEKTKPADPGAANGSESTDEMTDYQLSRALDLLSGLSLYKKPENGPTNGEAKP